MNFTATKLKKLEEKKSYNNKFKDSNISKPPLPGKNLGDYI